MLKERNQQLFREAMGNYPTGVAIVTTTDENGEPVGLTVNSFASVSLDPLLVLWSIDHGVSSLKSFTEGKGYAVHILADNQTDLSKTFASRDVDRFGSCEWKMSENNLPIINGALAVFECNLHKPVEAGDHTILIGEIINLDVNDADPMLYHRRNMGAIPEQFYAAE